VTLAAEVRDEENFELFMLNLLMRCKLQASPQNYYARSGQIICRLYQLVAYNVSINSLTKQLSLRWVRQWRKWCVLLETVEGEGHSGMLSDQSEILLCNVAISNSETFMVTHSTAIEALRLCSIPCTTSFSTLFM